MPARASSWPSTKPAGPAPIIATCVRMLVLRSHAAEMKATKQPGGVVQRRTRGDGHARQHHPLQCPCGTGSLVLVDQRLMQGAEQASIEPGERDQHLGGNWIGF